MPANVFLLLRHTGMRIGECVDLAYDCLHNVGPDRWAIHVPLMVRAGVSLPALMTLLGHVKAEMTMKYVQVAGNDLQREFHLARSQPRHLAPQPKAPVISPRAGLDGIADALLFAQHAIEMVRRSLSDGPSRRCLDR